MYMGDLGNLYVVTWSWKTECRVFLVPELEWVDDDDDGPYRRDIKDIRDVVKGIVGLGGTITVEKVEFTEFKDREHLVAFELIIERASITQWKSNGLLNHKRWFESN